MCSRNELFLRLLECYFGVYFPRCFTTREINTKITLSWALKQFVTRVHTLFYIYPPIMVVAQTTITSRQIASYWWNDNGVLLWIIWENPHQILRIHCLMHLCKTGTFLYNPVVPPSEYDTSKKDAHMVHIFVTVRQKTTVPSILQWSFRLFNCFSMWYLVS